MFGSLFSGFGVPPIPGLIARGRQQLQASYIAQQSLYVAQIQQQLSGLGSFNVPRRLSPSEWLEHLTFDERARLSPPALLALSGGSTEESFLNELRLIIGSRYV